LFDRIFGPEGAEAGVRGEGPESDSPSPHPPGHDPDADVASLRRAISQIDALPFERRRFLAGYAYILVRIARADADINDAETARMEQAVSAAGDLPEAQGALLVALAGRMGSLFGAAEDYALTRAFARTSSPQECQRLMRACVAVSVVDGALTSAETTELYEIGRELGFSAEDVDAIRDQVEPRSAAEPPTRPGPAQ
jgi:tellurite resistance protein